ncbi:MAG: CRTAC1 family protein [Proteobacteria bacterium]|nr:CRTAC1 family protein [Pseudomonadota bacterium]
MLLLLACQDPAPPAEVQPAPTYSLATLDPPFEHANAVWAGVALLDHDGDGLLDIYATNGETHPDALYRNVGGGQFVDMASGAGTDLMDENGAVVSGDVDNDGDPDLILSRECSAGSYGDGGASLNDGGKTLLRSNGDGSYTREAVFPGVTDTETPDALGWCTTSMTLSDWDGDGWLDLIVSNGLDPDIVAPWVLFKSEVDSRNYILLGDGEGNFDRLVLENHDLEQDVKYTATFASAVFDLDGDGRDDVLSGHGGYELQAYMQTEDGYFSLGRPTGDSDQVDSGVGLWMGLAVADFDRDGDLDMYATNQGHSTQMAGYDNHAGVEVQTYLHDAHRLFLADDGLLEPVDWPVDSPFLLAGDLYDPDAAGLDRYPWGWGVVALDANADGWMDVAWTGNNCSPPLHVCYDEDHGAGPGALLLNEAGEGWRDVTWESGVANLDDRNRYADGRGVATGDLNGDGYADLVIANRSHNPSQSDPLAQELGGLQVWLSDGGDNHWLQVDPVGVTSNRDGIGVEVLVTTELGTTVHRLGAGGGTNSSSERLITLGLGSAESADLEVRFPSGETVVLDDVAADQRLVVEEPS